MLRMQIPDLPLVVGRRRLCGEALVEIADHVVLGDPAGQSASRNSRQVEAMLGHHLSDDRGGLATKAGLHRFVGADRRDWWGHRLRGCRRRSNGRRGGRFRGRRSDGRRGGRGRHPNPGLSLDPSHQGLNRHRLPFIDQDLGQDPGARSGDLRVDFVGRDLEHRLVSLDRIAKLLEPLGQGALGNGLAHLGHHHVNSRHMQSPSTPPSSALP